MQKTRIRQFRLPDVRLDIYANAIPNLKKKILSIIWNIHFFTHLNRE